MQIERESLLYFGTNRTEQYDVAIPKLLELGFLEKQIVRADARKFAQNGDYIIIPWLPDNPSEIIIGRIKKGETIDPRQAGDGQIDVVQYDTLERIQLR